MRHIATVLLGLLCHSPVSALACPWCGTSISRRVNQEISGQGFLENLVVAALPFLVLLAIVVLIYLWPAQLKRSFRWPTPMSRNIRAAP
jgi:hypothetical protein